MITTPDAEQAADLDLIADVLDWCSERHPATTELGRAAVERLRASLGLIIGQDA